MRAALDREFQALHQVTPAEVERTAFPGDPVDYSGSAALKPLPDLAAEEVARLRERWEVLRGIDHPRLARALRMTRLAAPRRH